MSEYHDRGMEALRRGDAAQAVEQLQAAVAEAPDQAMRHGTLGAVMIDTGRKAEGRARLAYAIALDPSEPGFYYALWQGSRFTGDLSRAVILAPANEGLRTQLGIAFEGVWRNAEAHTHFRVSYLLDPSQPFTYSNLAVTGQNDPRVYRRALFIEPDFDKAHLGLSTALLGLGKRDEARRGLERTIALSPGLAEAYNNLGASYEHLGLTAKAVRAGLRAVRLNPSTAGFHACLGAFYEKDEKIDRSAHHFRAAISLSPEAAKNYQDAGVIISQMGNIPDARSAFLRSIFITQNRVRAFRYLLDLEDTKAPSPEVRAALLALLSKAEDLPAEDRIDLHFAAGKAFAGDGDAAAALDQWVIGNGLVRQTLPHDEAVMFRRFADIKKIFSAERLAAEKAVGIHSDIPVFIVGMPRSGSTLVEQIIASHPEAEGVGESQLLNRFLEESGLDAPNGLDPSVLTEGMRKKIGQKYLQAVTGHYPEAKCVVDKMLSHFQWVGLIHQIFPDARIIHISRDPIDSCMSNFSRLFATPHPYSSDLGDLGRYYRSYCEIMEHWRSVLPEGVMLDVGYEDLVEDFDTEAKRIIAFLGLPWDESCRSFHTTKRRIKTASQAQVRRPLYKSAVGRWQAYRPYLGPLLDALGPWADEQAPSRKLSAQ